MPAPGRSSPRRTSTTTPGSTRRGSRRGSTSCARRSPTPAIPLEVLPGGEIAIWRLIDLDDETLRALALGGGPYLLVESPFSPVVGDFEPMVLDLHARGHRVLLAHPERCPAFQRDPARLERLVDAGALVQVTAGSMQRRLRLDRAALHGGAPAREPRARRRLRRPRPRQAPARAAGGLPGARARRCPGIGEQAQWLTELVPRAVLDGTPCAPAAPAAQAHRPAAPARAQSLTIAITVLAITSTTISTCIQ